MTELNEMKTIRTSTVSRIARAAISDAHKNQEDMAWSSASAIKNIGGDILGHGVAGIVYDKPAKKKANVVYKTYISDPAYDDFINYARKNQDNPHMPRIYGKIKVPINKEGTQHLHVVKMEHLEPFDKSKQSISSHLFSPRNRYYFKGHPNEIDDHLESMSDDGVSTHGENLKDFHPDFHKAIKHINNIARDKQYEVDLHDNNVMQRLDGTPVITDPMVDFRDMGGIAQGTPLPAPRVHTKSIEDAMPTWKRNELTEMKTLRTSVISRVVNNAMAQNFETKPTDPHRRVTTDLRDIGARKLGAGAFGTVFDKPVTKKSDVVYKVYSNDPAYDDFINYARKNQDNPHVPKIYGKVKIPADKEGRMHLHVVKMERLQSLDRSNNPVSKHLFHNVDGRHIAGGFMLQVQHNLNNTPEGAALKEKFPLVHKVLHDLSSDPKHEGHDMDLHQNNIMQRADGTPVITDPMAAFTNKNPTNIQKLSNLSIKSHELRGILPPLDEDVLSEIKTIRTSTMSKVVRHAIAQSGDPNSGTYKLNQTIKFSGGTKLGAGMFGTVYKSPEERKSKFVYKTFDHDPAYSTFLSYARKNQDNPHVPKIYAHAKIAVNKEGTRHVNVVKMEKLSPITNDHPIMKHLDNSNYVGSKESIKNRLDDPDNDLARHYPEVHKILSDMANSDGEHSFDLHPGNIMQRHDGTPVITDPIAGYSRRGITGHVISAPKNVGPTDYKKIGIDEDAPTNSVGSGAIAGAGVGPKGEPGRAAVMMPMVRRSRDFAGKAVFKVPVELYNEARTEKRKHQRWAKYLEEEHEALRELREYANSNPNNPIIIENEKTGAMCYVRYGSRKR